MQELEKSLASWTQNLKELHTMKAELSQHVLVEDVMVLKEQIEHLHRQWEDLCVRVSQFTAGTAVLEVTEMSRGARQSRKELDFTEPEALFSWSPAGCCSFGGSHTV